MPTPAAQAFAEGTDRAEQFKAGLVAQPDTHGGITHRRELRDHGMGISMIKREFPK